MTSLKYDIKDHRVQYLISTDDSLGRLIRYLVSSELTIEEDGFQCLVKYIIGQQISDKARETLWSRLLHICVSVTPSAVLSMDSAELRGIGLSGRKVEYIKVLANSVIDSTIDFGTFPTLTNAEIIAKLTALKGIGSWTAEMYLIFSLGREDVLSRNDGTIKRTIQWMYALNKLPSSKEIASYFSKWNQYATIVSAYLWKSVALGLTQHSFDEVIPK